MTRWVEEKREFFERDIFQDFCRFCQVVHEQFSRFERSGTVSSPILHVLVGDFTNKGLLWRLKDNAHLTFRVAAGYNPAAHLLDWSLGYIYHECVKLMEDAHLDQSYVSRLQGFSGSGPAGQAAALLEGISSIQAQTGGSMEREVARLKELISLTRQLFCMYFSGMSAHRPLARLLYDKEALVRNAFQQEYPALIIAVYGDEPENMYIEAAYSLLESARDEDAAKAAAAALACKPESEAARECLGRLKNVEGVSA